MTYCKSSIRPHGGLISGGGGLFTPDLEKTMASVLHKELEYKVEIKFLVQDVGGHAAEDQKQIQTSS